MYSIFIKLVGFILKLVALFDEKIRLGVQGRSNSFKLIESSIKQNDRTLWFHCASLGEYEQGLPVFKELRKSYPEHKIVLTFFSPSGYEIRKNTDVADVTAYLPLDTKANAKKFIDLVHPEISVFVKYDIWPKYLKQLKQKKLKAYLISAAFRPKQIYFKWYGSQFMNALQSFDHIFVQNSSSKYLLEDHGFENVTITGDTRFDRVFSQLRLDNNLPIIEDFIKNSVCTVIGSSWPADEAILIPYINEKASKYFKFIIAPHEIKDSNINRLLNDLKSPTLLYSEIIEETNNSSLEDAQVLIIDNIGLLSKIYSYANIAYIGGAMGHTGLHNILEPAVFGVPIVIGKNHSKFPEAIDMISNAGVFSISDKITLKNRLDSFLDDCDKRKSEGLKNFNYVKKNCGSVIQIMKTIRI